MSDLQFLSSSEEETDRLGGLLAEVLPPGTVVALLGTLGAAKTRLVQGVVAALGHPREDVTSPTFVLLNEYLGGKLPVYHFDVYRLSDEDEFQELGPEEYFEGAGLTFVEWADRVEQFLPPDYLEIRIEVLGETERGFTIRASTEKLRDVVSRLAEAM